jgi:sugar/nucleoside kinase (ribokinase family)
MSLTIIGSVALDSVETPFGETADALGGSALYFGCAAVHLHPLSIIGVVGNDYPFAELEKLASRGVNISGVERVEGESFRWKGKYSYDLQNRETLDTRLGVFADFDPKVPEELKDSKYVFLGNIDPLLQMSVLKQMNKPKFVVCDTMNFWISSKKNELLELMKDIDLLMVNDAEARELSGDWNIHRAARWILDRGPKMVVIKQGEYGAVLVTADSTFYVPGYPLEEIYDPTGAGDAFAGGFMGHLARTDDLSTGNLRVAMVYGSTMGSFAVENFSVNKLNDVNLEEIEGRARKFADLVQFKLEDV